jgi:hypothetical protein
MQILINVDIFLNTKNGLKKFGISLDHIDILEKRIKNIKINTTITLFELVEISLIYKN